MGSATDAMVVWGVDLGAVEEFEDEELADRFLDDEFDPDDLGLPQGVSLVLHCSDSCPAYIVGITRSLQSAKRGYPERLNILGCTHEDQCLIDEALKILKIPQKRAVWLLASHWEDGGYG